MTPDALTQEEIDALLKGSSGGGGGSTVAQLSSLQQESLRKYGDRMAATQTDMLAAFLGDQVEVRRKGQSSESADAVAGRLEGKTVVCTMTYEGKISGKTLLLFSEKVACRIGGTMVGEPEAEEFGEMVMDAFKEVCNTIGGNLNSVLSSDAGGTIALSETTVELVECTADYIAGALGKEGGYGTLLYTLTIGSKDPVECRQIVSSTLLNTLDALNAPPKQAGGPSPSAPSAPKAAPVHFEPLTQEGSLTAAPANLDLIMDIGLEIRVELGRTNMKIRDVLNLGSGSVVELDKLAGEPVDLLVNDVIFAKGEVVVIDENFGVRITEILTLQERIKTLGELKD